MSDRITYRDILDRCKRDVMEYLPELPKENTVEAWESFKDEIEEWRDDSLYDNASESVDQWDWTIYTHCGLKIVHCLSSSELYAAEESFFDCHSDLDQDTLGGVYEFASKVAYFALVNIWQETAQECVDDLLELAENQLENLGSE